MAKQENDKKKRLADALRTNLHRRKAQSRARGAASPSSAGSPSVGARHDEGLIGNARRGDSGEAPQGARQAPQGEGPDGQA